MPPAVFVFRFFIFRDKSFPQGVLVGWREGDSIRRAWQVYTLEACAQPVKSNSLKFLHCNKPLDFQNWLNVERQCVQITTGNSQFNSKLRFPGGRFSPAVFKAIVVEHCNIDCSAFQSVRKSGEASASPNCVSCIGQTSHVKGTQLLWRSIFCPLLVS